MNTTIPTNDFAWKQALSHLTPGTATWQRRAMLRAKEMDSFKDLLKLLDDLDANVRIVTAQLVGNLRQLLTADQRAAAIDAVLRMLDDSACNEYEYGSWQCDEESVLFVNATAAETLAKLGYAEDARAVLKKALAKGIPVKVSSVTGLR